MNIERSLSLYCLLIMTMVATPALAQVNITVSGKINEVSCTPTLTGPRVSGNTVDLEPADLSDFPTTGSTAKPTEITFTLTGCGMSTAKNNMWVHFTSATTTSGGIMVPTSGSTGVGFEIMDVKSDGSMGGRARTGGTAGNQPTNNQGTAAAFTGSFPNRDAVKKYVIRYVRLSSAGFPVSAGDISTAATYTVKYY